MIIRVFWKSSSVQEPSKETESVIRIEGGWWFSETCIQSGVCSAWNVISRQPLQEDGACIEVLVPLPDSFIQTPCWQDGPPQLWSRLEGGWLLPSGLQMFQGQPSQLSLALQVPEHLRNEALRKIQPILTDESLVVKDLSGLLKPVLQESKRKEVSPSQKKQRYELSGEIHPMILSVPKESYQAQVQSLESRGPVSGSPKDVQTGSLCLPTLLPDGQPPRKKGNRPQGRRGPPSQDHRVSQTCLIDLQLS